MPKDVREPGLHRLQATVDGLQVDGWQTIARFSSGTATELTCSRFTEHSTSGSLSQPKSVDCHMDLSWVTQGIQNPASPNAVKVNRKPLYAQNSDRTPSNAI